MSFDLAVWFPHERFSNDRAGKVYRGLCDGDLEPLQPHPAIDAFYRELTDKHPEIDDVPEERIDDKDLCPWSVAQEWGRELGERAYRKAQAQRSKSSSDK